MKKMLMLASVASMIDQFNMSNIRMLLSMGYQVDVACNFIEGSTCSADKISKLVEELKHLGIGCHQIDFSRSIMDMKSNLIAYKQVKRLMADRQYHFVHCHSPIGGVVVRLAGRATRTKVIYTAHGFHFYKGGPLKNWLMYYPVEWLLSFYTDVLITINAEDQQLAQTKLHAKKAYRIPGIGIDLERFVIRQFDRDAYRSSLGIEREDFMILSVGELNDNKNQSLIIKSIADLKDTHIHYFIVGIGKNSEMYRQLATGLGVEAQIHILGFRTDIPQLNHSADLFVFPSIREGLGIAALEALACGTPVCGMNTRGINEYVMDGVTGYLFENEVESASIAIQKMKCRNPDVVQKMRESCIETAKKYSIKQTDHIMRKIYMELK